MRGDTGGTERAGGPASVQSIAVKPIVATIGYQGTTIATVLQALIEAKVELLVARAELDALAYRSKCGTSEEARFMALEMG